jgi:calcineurin-like phosphoesterase family protein
MIFFTADPHYFHKLCARKRGFQDIHQMNEWLVSVYNHRVSKRDTVYILGDFSWRDPDSILKRLNGRLILIHGNHDSNKVKKHPRWVISYPVLMCKHEGLRIWLSHYAHLTWPKKHRGAYHLFGHSHGGLSHNRPLGINGSMDVGVDTRTDLGPYSLEEILKILQK